QTQLALKRAAGSALRDAIRATSAWIALDQMEESVQLSRYAAGAFAAATLLGATNAQAQTAPAPAQSGEDITALRHDMDALRREYEGRIADLEARLARAEAAEGAPPGTPAPADQAGPANGAASADQSQAGDQSAPINTASNDAYSPPPPMAAGPTSQNLYNPGIAAV